MSDPLEIRLVPHVATEIKNSPTGPVEVEVEFDQYLVYVHSVGLAHRNKDQKLQVGIMSKRPGANFCPIIAFYEFHYPQQQFIVAEAKRLHGQATPAPHVEVPPPLVEAWDDDLDDEESESA
jgi:hypothetical protein